MLVFFLFFMGSSLVVARGVDQTFTQPLSWGDWFSSLFGRSGSGKSYAIVIGISRFKYYQNLNTTNDPIEVKNYLLDEAGFNSVRLITDEQVNLRKIRKIMDYEIPKTLKSNDRFLFYWQGHGETDTKGRHPFGYLPVTDSPKDRFDTMLDMADLTKWDKKIRVKQAFYLLDACFSGFAGYQVQNGSRKRTLEQIDRPSRQILTAGLANEETLVLNQKGSSIFTSALLDGMRGAADTHFKNLNKDGIISARELEVYIKRRVAEESSNANWSKPITPILSRLNQHEGDFFFFTKKTIAAASANKGKIASGVTYQVSTMSGKKEKSVVTNNMQPISKIISKEEKKSLDRLVTLARNERWSEVSNYAWKKPNESKKILKYILNNATSYGDDFNLMIRLSTQLKISTE